MARVLIAGIGTGPSFPRGEKAVNGTARSLVPSRQYNSANYMIDNELYEKKELIAQALIEHYKIERVFLVGTARSMWERIYELFSANNFDEEYWLELCDAIEKSNHAQYCLTSAKLKKLEQAIDRELGLTGSRCLLIKYGLNTEELMYNFDVFMDIAELLQDGDEIYLDITHSFRSLSLFQYVMIDYIENLADKRIVIKKVFYGMLECAREMEGKAPVVDLKMIYDMTRWIKAIHELDSYGNGYLVAELLEEQDKNLAKKMRGFSDLINLNYLSGIRNQQDQLIRALPEQMPGPAARVVRYIKEYLMRFSRIREDSLFQLEMARWYFENKRYATGYIVMAESILTRVCELLGWKWDEKVNREEAKKVLSASRSDLARQLNDKYRNIARIRNNIAHALSERDERNYLMDINNVFIYCDTLKNIYCRIKPDDLNG